MNTPRQVDSRIALAVLGAVVMGVGSVGPWASALGGLFTVQGTAGDGKITLACAVVAGIAIVLASNGMPVGVLAALATLVGTGVGLYDLVDASSKFAQANGVAQVDWGLYATVIGGAACLAGTIAARGRLGRRRADQSTVRIEAASPTQVTVPPTEPDPFA